MTDKNSMRSDQAKSKARAKTSASPGKQPFTGTGTKDMPIVAKGSSTYETLVASAAALLGEIGFEKLTTNAICAHADMTPPAFYRYFKNKYEIVEVLARRLLKRQGDAFAIWLMETHGSQLVEKPVEFLEQWYRISANIVATEPGALWTMRALRAMPNLAHVRVEFQREMTDRLVLIYSRILPDLAPDLLWARLRIWVEIGWVVDELSMEEDRIPREILFHEVARHVKTPISRGSTYGQAK